MASRRRRRSERTSVVRVTDGRDRRAITRLLESLPRPVTTVWSTRVGPAFGPAPRSYVRSRLRQRPMFRSILDNRLIRAVRARRSARVGRRELVRPQLRRLSTPCDVRRRRREVIHAFGLAGASGGVYKRRMAGARRSEYSQMRC